jgi:hypothetical protein
LIFYIAKNFAKKGQFLRIFTKKNKKTLKKQTEKNEFGREGGVGVC